MPPIIAPSACPKWERCNAPLCPLDPDLFKRVMQDGDPVCHYLLEAVKADAEANFRRRGRTELFDAVSVQVKPLSARWGRIRHALERAKTSGSRLARVAPWEVDRGA
jgi:hypothetical protein